MEDVICVENLSKRFEDLEAVSNLSFTVSSGTIHGFLGQNGAGKSTTIRMLLTLIKPTSGSIKIFGKDLSRHRPEILRQTGAIIEKPDLYNYLTALENIQLMARLSGCNLEKKDLLRQLEIVGLSDRAHSKVKTFSQGMKQRLGIACAMVHGPKLIILDEPTNGLDPQGIADIRNLILHLCKNEKKTILVSSHLLSEMELIADSMLIIDKGKKIVEGSVSDLLHPADMLVEIDTVDNAGSLQKLRTSQWASKLQPGIERILMKLHKEDIPLLNKDLVQMGVDVLSLQPKHSLEDYFLSLTTSNQHVAAYKN
ncbi:MAG TPA: ABC transporter ATP-binding protein [Chitinophagaceae bacterium]|nr:ABC transporter ATP-binding protein [Chitinophagaceae bacterium]